MWSAVRIWCLVYCCVLYTTSLDAVQSISIEYRQDALDYGMEKKHFLRVGATVKTDTTELATAFVKSDNSKTNATWSFITNGDYAAIAGGYYFLHHAAGLLLGKSAEYNPDPYSINKQIKDSFLSLCRSGNPQYAMYGIVASLYDVKDISTIRLDAGISNKECFVTSADIQKTIYPYSIHGLLSHYQKEGQNTEPVQVITHFARAIVKPGNFFTLQGCYYATSVYHENARLLFDTSLQNNAAIESFGGYSLYMQYQDKKIKLFMEYAISQVVMNNEGDSENKYTNAYYWGMSVTGKIFSASGIMQKSDKYFYAPFGNTFGSNSPRDIYYYSVKLKPAKKVTFRWAYIDQNNLLPSQYYAEYPHKRIHSVTVAYKNNSFVIKTDYRNALFYKDGMEDRVSRLQQKVVWGITQNASLHLKCGLYQGNATAWYLASGMGFKFGRLQNDCGAIYAHTKDEKIYIALLPLPQTSIMSEAIATSSFFIVERLRYSNSSCKLSARLVWQMHPQKQTLGELSASVWF